MRPDTTSKWYRLAYGLALTVSLLLEPDSAAATVGGPAVAELLGYDPSSRHFYYAVHDHSEGGDPSRIIRRALVARETELSRFVPLHFESKESLAEHRAARGLIDSLKSVLVPLEAIPSDRVRCNVRLLATRYVSDTRRYLERGQYILEVTATAGAFRASTVLAATCNQDVSVKEVVRVPHEPAILALVSYTADPYETCYTRDAVLILRPYGSSK